MTGQPHIARQLYSKSTRDGNAPAKLRRRDLVEIFHQPRRGSPSPDPRKSLKADEHEQIYVHDDYGVHDAYDGPKFTSSSLTEELTQAQVECSTKASLPDKTQWPPRGLDSLSQLSLEEAKNLVGEGALSFEGLIVQAIHTSFRQARRFATVGVGAAEDGIEAVGNSETSPPDMSLALVDRPGHTKPSETLEQPSMTQCFGMLPGTVTLNHYINTMSRSSQPTNFPEYAILPRQTDSLLVLQRLHYLQGGLDADPEFSDEFLNTQLVYNSKWQKGDSNGLETQMAVLVAALNNPVWVDFSKSGSQVLARYFDTSDMEVEERFYQQLLLSVELSLRIQAVTSWAEGLEEQSIICSIPEKVAWDLALAKVWQKKMALEPLDDTFHRAPTIFRITALTKNIQKERLLDFARKMKWVGIADVEHILEVTTDGEIPLESRSPHSASWMTGTILPGPSASWLIMKSLIDCDTNVTNSPPGFDQMHSNLGFQHRGNTFWYWKSIVAKVMGACKGVKQDYGWVGPCLPSDDLSTLQVVLVHSESSQQRMSKKYINSMSARSTALGPPADSYPVKEYVLPLPDLINTVDSVRTQKLAFKPRSLPTLAAEPRTCDVAVMFAIGTEVIPIRLRYDVSFICAPPCHGIHPLFWDYAYETVKPDEMILHQRSCNGITVRSSNPSSQATFTTSNSESYCSASTTKSATGPEKMLVVEAFGVADNDVLARAYASFIGVSAIVANVQDTCMACAIRMAYAGSVPMVILNEGHHGED